MKYNVIILFTLLMLTYSCGNNKNTSVKMETTRTNEQGERLLYARFCDNETGEDTEKGEIYQPVKGAIKLYGRLVSLSSENAFLTIEFSDTQSIQFVFDNNKWLVEITNDSKDRLFKQRYATPDECIEMIKAAYTGDPNKLEGFVYVPIMEKTLDDVLREQRK